MSRLSHLGQPELSANVIEDELDHLEGEVRSGTAVDGATIDLLERQRERLGGLIDRMRAQPRAAEMPGPTAPAEDGGEPLPEWLKRKEVPADARPAPASPKLAAR